MYHVVFKDVKTLNIDVKKQVKDAGQIVNMFGLMNISIPLAQCGIIFGGLLAAALVPGMVTAHAQFRRIIRWSLIAVMLGVFAWRHYQEPSTRAIDAVYYAATAVLAVGVSRLITQGIWQNIDQAIRPGALTADFGLDRQVHLRHVLRMAVCVEEKGGEFYTTFLNTARNPRVKELLGKIMAEEYQHKQMLVAMLSRWKTLPDDAEIFSRFDAELKVRGIFFSIPNKYATEEDVLAYAIEQEKKLVDFYKSFETAFPRGWKRLNIQSLVMMERTHVNDLKNIRKAPAA